MNRTWITLGLAVSLTGWLADAGFGQTNLIERGRGVVVGANTASVQSSCVACHKLDGVGDPVAAFPKLSGQSAGYLEKALEDYASGVRPNDVMTPIAKALSREDRRAVSAYYAAQRGSPSPAPPQPLPAALQTGALLDSIGRGQIQACQNCHGPLGRGLPPAYPALAGQHATYLEQQLHAWKTGERKGDPDNVMRGIALKLSDEDIRSLARYFERLPPLQPDPSDIAPANWETGSNTDAR